MIVNCKISSIRSAFSCSFFSLACFPGYHHMPDTGHSSRLYKCNVSHDMAGPQHSGNRHGNVYCMLHMYHTVKHNTSLKNYFIKEVF